MTRVVFLGRLAKEDVTKRLQSISDVDLFVSEDMDEILRELPGAEVFVTADVRGCDACEGLPSALGAMPVGGV
jgi:hypothetical protein